MKCSFFDVNAYHLEIFMDINVPGIIMVLLFLARYVAY